MIKRLISLFLFFVSLCFSNEGSFAYIHNFSGEVFIESNNEKGLILPAISGRSVGNGNIIRVKGNSFCDIYSNDKQIFIRLDSDTDVKFVETEETREIYLKDGSLYINNRNPDISKKTFVFADFSQIYLTNSSIWLSSNDPDHDKIYSFGKEINISDKYKGIRYHKNTINMIHASEEEILSIESYNPKEDFKHIVPDYIFDEFLIVKDKYIVADSLLFDLGAFELIPDYYANINTEVLKESNFGFNINLGFSRLYDANYIATIIEPYFKFKNVNLIFKIDEYFGLEDSEINVNDWTDPSTLLSKLNYLSYYNESKTIFLNVGKLKNLTFGHGQVLHKYSNSYNYPIMQRTGVQLHISPKNKSSYNVDLFISDISQVINGGGFLGYHFSYHLSKFFPLTLGYGYLSDMDQYSEVDPEVDYDISSKIQAHELDIEYKVFENNKYRVDLISEFDVINFPETIKYYRYDGNPSEVLKQKDGTLGRMFGSKVTFDSGYKIIMGLHYNDPLYTPYYFSSTYDFEKVRIVESYDITTIDINDNDIPCDLGSDGACDILYISKEWYPLLRGGEYVYPTVGASFQYEYNYYNKRGLTLSGMYLLDNDSNSSNSYYLFDIEFFSKGRYLLKQLDEFSLYFHRNFSLSSVEDAKENLMFGIKFDISVIESIKLMIDAQSVFYDINQDANVDNINSLNFQIKYNIPDPMNINFFPKKDKEKKIENNEV